MGVREMVSIRVSESVRNDVAEYAAGQNKTMADVADAVVKAGLAALQERKRPKPDKAARGNGSIDPTMQRIVDMLKEKPRTPIATIAVALYEKDDATARTNVRSYLSRLGSAGKLRNVGRGAWEAVA